MVRKSMTFDNWRTDGSTRNWNRRTLLKVAGASGMGAVAGCTGMGGGSDEEGEWTIGTSGPESATHASGVAMSQIISEESDTINMSAQTTQGTAANPRLMDEGDIDVAQSTAWATTRANAGEEPLGDPPLDMTITQVVPFMTIEYYLIKRDVPELEDIQSVSDIPQDGSISMAFGQRGGSNWYAALDGFALSGIENVEENYDLQSLSWGDQRAQLSDGRLDIGVGYSISETTLVGWEQELDATQEIDIVEWEFDETDVAESGLPYEYSEAPADVWEQDLTPDSFPGVADAYLTVFPAEIEQELAYEFVTTIHENIETVRSASEVLQAAGREFTEEMLATSPNAPIHPGTEQFLREEDMWRDDFVSLDEYEG